jgi:ribosomal protein L12E/L44/L45/RPP1/RPP2
MEPCSHFQTVLESVGIDADSERLEKLLGELKGKDINEVWFAPNMFPATVN